MHIRARPPEVEIIHAWVAYLKKMYLMSAAATRTSIRRPSHPPNPMPHIMEPSVIASRMSRIATYQLPNVDRVRRKSGQAHRDPTEDDDINQSCHCGLHHDDYLKDRQSIRAPHPVDVGVNDHEKRQ